MVENLYRVDLAELIIITSAFLVSNNASIDEVPESIIERLCDLAEYELLMRAESPLH